LDRQRIDKWLWHARVVRTRSAAASLASSGHVRVNGQRILAPSHGVRPGDVVAVVLDRAVRVLKVVGFAERRGSAEAARALCENVAAARNETDARASLPPVLREAGGGRPTKRERRAIERFTGKNGV